MPLYQSELDSVLKGIKTSNTANANASVLQPISSLQSNQQTKQPTSGSKGGFFDGLGHIISTGAKDVGNIALNTGKAIVQGAVQTGANVSNDIGNAEVDLGNALGVKTLNGQAPQTETTKQQFGNIPVVGKNIQNQNAEQQIGNAISTGSLAIGGGEVADVAGQAAKVGLPKVLDALTTAGKVGTVGAVGSAGNEVATNPNASVGDVLKAGAQGFAGGALLSGAGAAGGAVLNQVFNRGAQGALDELKANLVTNKAADLRTQAETDAQPKALPQGNIQNNSTSTVVDQPGTPGTPAVPGTVQTPKTLPVSDQEYTQRFNALSKSYDAETKAASQLPPLAQKIALDDVSNRHEAALNQLNDEYQGGKPNPDYQPAQSGTPAVPGTPPTTKEVPSGFVIQTPADTGRVQIQNGQAAQLNQRIGQINGIIKGAQQNGTARTADELRALMRERQQAQDVLSGKANYDDVYGNKAQPGPVNSLPFDKNAAPGETTAPTSTNAPSTPNTGGAKSASAPAPTPPVNNLPGSFMGKLAKVAQGDTKQPILNRNYVVGKYQDLIKPVQDAAKGMSQHDIQLIDKIEGGHTVPAAADAHLAEVTKQADNPAQFAKVVSLMRQGYDTRLANDTVLGRDVGVRNNYLQHFFDHTDQTTADKLDQLQAQKAHVIKNEISGYTHARTIENYDQAAQLGLKRANANALEDYTQAMTQAGGEHGGVALRQGLEEAHPGQVVQVGRLADGTGAGNLKISGGTTLSLPKELAAKYNARAPYEYQDSVAGKGLKAYDSLNAAVKLGKLGGGLFHSFTTAGTTAGQQLTSLNLFKHPVENLKVIGGTLSTKAHEANFNQFEKEGSLDFARQTGVTLAAKDILADANVKTLDNSISKATNATGAIKNTALKPIKALHDMVFQRQIPEAKMLMMRQSMKQKFPDMDFANPTTEQVQYGRQVAAAVNNMGGINRAVSGLNYNTAKHLSRVVLATDFTEGKFRTLFNAFAKGGPEGKIARQMVVGKSLLFAIPGMVAGVANGTINPNDPKSVADALVKQFVTPSVPTGTMSGPSKTNPGGTPQVAELPKTFISELGSIIAPALSSTSTNKLSGVTSYAKARLAALPSTAMQVGSNSDYYGNKLWGTDKNGNPISPGKAAVNIASEVAPIPAVQGSKTATGQQNAKTAALNTVGFRVVNDTNSPQGQHTKAVSDFYNVKNQLTVRKAAVTKQITNLISQGNVNQAQRVAQQWNSSLNAQTLPFRTKYASHYNPAWDDKNSGFNSYIIPMSGRAVKTRQSNIAETAKIDSNNY